MTNTETPNQAIPYPGDRIAIREENWSSDGVVVAVERGLNYAGEEVEIIIADFGGEKLGRCPMPMPKTWTLIKDGE